MNTRVIIFMACCIALAYGLFRPQAPPDLFEQSDKFMHLLAFVTFAFCANMAFPPLRTLKCFSLILLLGPALELAQHAVQPVRTFSLEDAVANLAGMLIGGLAWWCWSRRRGLPCIGAGKHQ